MDVCKQIDTFKRLKSDRANWDSQYQILGEFVSQVKQNFEERPSAGEFLSEEIFDSTGTFASQAGASALLGMLWPGTAKQAIEIKPPSGLEETTANIEFYERMTEKLTAAMDDPSARLAVSLDEYMLDQFIFGTSGIGINRGKNSKLAFRAYGVPEMYIVEGADGAVEAVYLHYQWSVDRIIAEYGEDKVSAALLEKHSKGLGHEKAKILICIMPREKPKAEKGVLSMPFMSLHIEQEAKHLLKESGFSSFPIAVGRFRKLLYETYGRSPSMAALSDIREANALREAVIIATEKALDMPKGVYDDGVFGGGVIDTSARAVNVFNSSNMTNNGNPVFDIGSPPDIIVALARLESLSDSISQHYFLDRLIDFNNDTQMTFGEAQIRNQIRNSSLLSLYSRQIADVFTVFIQRAAIIMFEDGDFGVIKGSEQEAALEAAGEEIYFIPDDVAEMMTEGKDVFEINYRTQAANASRSEEYIAIADVIGFGAQMVQIDASVRHRINFHEAIKGVADIRGLPVDIIRADDEVDALIKQEQEQEQMAQGMQAAEQGANIVDKLASANVSARL